jgi:outer membrane protein assembly factor BamB
MGNGISNETGTPVKWSETENIFWNVPLWASPASLLPVKWSETENILWKLRMPGMAGSTPIIWEKHIFLTSEAEKGLVLLCASTDGKKLWTKPLSSSKGKHVMRDEGCAASASPCTDGRHVYSFVGTGDFACHDFDGKEIWHFNAQERYGKFQIQFGLTSTPVLHQGKLYWQLIHSGGNYVICLDAATGKDIWKVDRPSDGHSENEHSYASAQLWEKGSDAYLIVHGNDYTTAHRLDNGSEIWRLGELNPKTRYNPTLRFVASPVVTPDLIVVPTAKNGPVVGVKPTAQGTIGPGSNYEQWRRTRETPDVPSPLVHDGLVYLCRETGVLICMDAATGKEYYNQRIRSAGVSRRYRASPTYADGKIYCTARDGVVTVMQAGKEFQKLSENKLTDDISASPVFSGGKLYLRGYQSLYCIAEKK